MCVHDKIDSLKLAAFWSAELSCLMMPIADTATETRRNVA